MMAGFLGWMGLRGRDRDSFFLGIIFLAGLCMPPKPVGLYTVYPNWKICSNLSQTLILVCNDQVMVKSRLSKKQLLQQISLTHCNLPGHFWPPKQFFKFN